MLTGLSNLLFGPTQTNFILEPITENANESSKPTRSQALNVPNYIHTAERLQHHIQSFACIPVTAEVSSTVMDIQNQKVFWQNPKEDLAKTIDMLKSMKGDLDQIYLCIPTDELLSLIAELFPNLSTLSLSSEVAPFKWEFFTDYGLKSIGKLENLKHFYWYSLDAPSWNNSLEGLLNLPHLKANLETFHYHVYNIYAKEAEALAGYENLKSLSLPCIAYKNDKRCDEVLVKLLQSPSLQFSLRSLSLEYATFEDPKLADEFMETLCGFTKLTSFSFTPQLKEFNEVVQYGSPPSLYSHISSEQVQKFLHANPDLKELFWSGIVIDNKICEVLSGMKALELINLANCANVSSKGIEVLCEGEAPLKSVTVGWPVIGWDMSLFGKFPHLEELSLSGLSQQHTGIKELCSPSNIENLKSLTLIQCAFHSEDYAALKDLENLECLTINDCPQYNDDSLMGSISAQSKIKTLRFNRVSIADGASDVFSKMPYLTGLVFNDCFALTSKNIKSIMTSSLQKSIQMLVVSFDSLSLEDIAQLVNFSALEALAVYYNPENKGEKKIKKIFEIANGEKWQMLFTPSAIDGFNQLKKERPYFQKV